MHTEKLVDERIVKLEQELNECKQVEEQLKVLLQDKDVFIKEFRHQIRNDFQVISSLVHLQSIYIKDKQVLAVFEEIQNRIKTIAMKY